MAITLLGPPFWQFLDDNGVPVAGGFLYVYEAGTATPVTVYSDHLGATEQTNPVELNAAGKSGQVFVETGQRYKIVLTDAEAAQIDEEDNIPVYEPSS